MLNNFNQSFYPLINQFFPCLRISNTLDLGLSNSFGLLYVALINFSSIHSLQYLSAPLIFTTSFHDFPFQYRIYIKFVFDFLYGIGQTSFMSIYFMCKATFMIVISLVKKGLALNPHTLFFLIPIVTVTARVEYFSHIHYTLFLTSSLEGGGGNFLS